MTFERPAALLLLLALPLLWWLHRRLRGPLEIVVASVLPFLGAPEGEARAARRRTLDGELVCASLAAAALVLAAAGLRVAQSEQRELFVLVDDSPSMWLLRESGMSTQEEVLRRIRDSVGDDVRLRLVRERDGVRGDPERLDDPFGRSADDPLVADGLPGSLLGPVEAARGAGLPGIVIATDQTLDSGSDVAVVLPSTPPAPHGWIRGVALDDGVLVVSLAHDVGAPAAEVVLTAAGREVARKRVEPARAALAVRLEAPAAGAFEVAAHWYDAEGRESGAAGDVGARVAVVRTPRIRRVRLVSQDGASMPRIGAALAALGVTVTDGGDHADAVFAGTGGAIIGGGDPPTAYFWLEHGAAEVLSGDRVSGKAAFADVVPRATSRLVARGRLDGPSEAVGEHLLVDDVGPLARRSGPAPIAFFTTLDPEHRDSTWHRDPSFVVFVGHVLDVLAGGADELEVTRAVPESEQGALPPDPPETGRDVAAEVSRLVGRPAADRGAPLGRALGLLAAALIAAAALLSGRRFFAAHPRAPAGR